MFHGRTFARRVSCVSMSCVTKTCRVRHHFLHFCRIVKMVRYDGSPLEPWGTRRPGSQRSGPDAQRSREAPPALSLTAAHHAPGAVRAGLEPSLSLRHSTPSVAARWSASVNVQKEHHFGTDVYVTRKGAVSAKAGRWASFPAAWARAATSCAARATRSRSDASLSPIGRDDFTWLHMLAEISSRWSRPASRPRPT